MNGWVKHREAGDLEHHRAHYDVAVMAPANGDLLVSYIDMQLRTIFRRYKPSFTKISLQIIYLKFRSTVPGGLANEFRHIGMPS